MSDADKRPSLGILFQNLLFFDREQAFSGLLCLFQE